MCAVGVFTGKGAVTRTGVALARGTLNMLYRKNRQTDRSDEVLFFSRQSNEPSKDFLELGRQFEERGYKPVYMTRKLSVKHFASYVGFAREELRALGRCKICIVDRYDPVICLLDLAGQPQNQQETDTVWTDFPTQPVVIQLWHAFGAFKKFGWQSLGTAEAHPVETAQIFKIHHNYSWVLCSGEGARKAFAEAFHIPVERVVALPRPEYFELKQRAEQTTGCLSEKEATLGEAKPKLLFAPTLRKSHESSHPLRDLYTSNEWQTLEDGFDIEWSFHPLEETGLAATNINDALPTADYVITDYSSIVFEAWLLKKRVAFYVPDLAEYRATPGLNTDPEQLCPDLCFESFEALQNALVIWQADPSAYPQDQFDAFASTAFDEADYSPTPIVDFVLSQLT